MQTNTTQQESELQMADMSVETQRTESTADIANMATANMATPDTVTARHETISTLRNTHTH